MNLAACKALSDDADELLGRLILKHKVSAVDFVDTMLALVLKVSVEAGVSVPRALAVAVSTLNDRDRRTFDAERSRLAAS